MSRSLQPFISFVHAVFIHSILQFNREIEYKNEEVKLNVYDTHSIHHYCLYHHSSAANEFVSMKQRMNSELWDCSGDSKYEPCWPAIMAELHGIAVVFDPTSKQQANDVRVWYGTPYTCHAPRNANRRLTVVVVVIV